jgi:F0F1-type ATP synthase alpha subunit
MSDLIKVRAQELVQFSNGAVMGIAFNLESDNVGVICWVNTRRLKKA